MEGLVAKRAVCDCHQLCTKELVKQKIGRWLVRHFSVEDEDAVQAVSCCGSGCLAAVVRLQRAARDQGSGALLERFGDQEFQFACLVSTEGKTGLVVAFDPDVRSAQRFGETRQFFDRCWKMSESQSWNIHQAPPMDCLVFALPRERMTSSTRGMISEYILYQSGLGA